MNGQTLEEYIHSKLKEGTRVSVLTKDECIVRLPFWDSSGDPVQISIAADGEQATIDDTGSIAALLFSLGQHMEGTPAFRLLKQLERSRNLHMDFDEGLVNTSIPIEFLYDGIVELLKVILALDIVVPHIRVAPRRMRSSGGPRLKSRIRREYRELNILDLVDPDFQLDGETVQGWPVDFHWSIQSNGSKHDVNVVAADLSVSDPLQKAQRIAALSMDTHSKHREGAGNLRVVMETQSGDSRAKEAGEFIRRYSKELEYEVFDFSEYGERTGFLNSAVDEITGQAGSSWRDLWKSRRELDPELSGWGRGMKL